MADPRNGRGGFKEFAKHETDAANNAAPLDASKAVKAPTAATPATKPDIAPAAPAEKRLPNTLADAKPTVRR